MLVSVETGTLYYLCTSHPEMDALMMLLVMVQTITLVMLMINAVYRCTCFVLAILLKLTQYLIIPNQLFKGKPHAEVVHPIEKFGESYKDV